MGASHDLAMPDLIGYVVSDDSENAVGYAVKDDLVDLAAADGVAALEVKSHFALAWHC